MAHLLNTMTAVLNHLIVMDPFSYFPCHCGSPGLMKYSAKKVEFHMSMEK